jgi:hypothetical protein
MASARHNAGVVGTSRVQRILQRGKTLTRDSDFGAPVRRPATAAEHRAASQVRRRLPGRSGVGAGAARTIGPGQSRQQHRIRHPAHTAPVVRSALRGQHRPEEGGRAPHAAVAQFATLVQKQL